MASAITGRSAAPNFFFFVIPSFSFGPQARFPTTPEKQKGIARSVAASNNPLYRIAFRFYCITQSSS
jgi:hypothetical protein